MSSFEEINIGDTLGPLELFVSKDQCRLYAKTMGMGDIAGRFTDDEAAKKEGLPGMILPGNMSLGLLSKLVTDWIGSGNRVAVADEHDLSRAGAARPHDHDSRIYHQQEC